MSPEFKLILQIVFGVIAAIIAWELRGRIKNRDRKIKEEISDGLMEAIVVCKEGGTEVTRNAIVKYDQSNYHLTISSSNKDTAEINNSFKSMKEIEDYLEENTMFRLSDFIKK